MPGQTVGERLVMPPMEPLVAGGAAEAFERQRQSVVPRRIRAIWSIREPRSRTSAAS